VIESRSHRHKMATNSDHKTQKITITKKTVKITNRDEKEFPRPLKKEGKYLLPWETEHQPPTTMTNFKYFFTIDETGVPNEEKLNEEPLMQMMAVDRNRIENPPHNGVRVTWLGHASALFQLDNVNFLVNPNFNDRGIKYYHPGDNKRYRRPVYAVDDLPRIDCVFITNTHFDYLDLGSVRSLNEKFGDMVLWYVPMGVQAWMEKAGCSNVVELDWWKEDEVDFVDHTIINEQGESEEVCTTTFHIACTPSQNYHSRDIADDNGCLWCSWVVMSPRYKIFLAGATGYQNEIFKSIGRRFGPFHMCALPIGGYEPAWKFAYGNVTPEQSVQMHKDLLAMCSVALSWGTFSNSNEHYLEPPQRLKDELQKEHLSEMQFFLLRHGESRLVEIKEAGNDENEADGKVDADAHLKMNGHVELNGHVEANGHTNGHASMGVDLNGDGAVDVHITGVKITGVEMDGDADMGDASLLTTTTTTTTVNGGDGGIDIDGDGTIDINIGGVTIASEGTAGDADVDLDALLGDMNMDGGATITTTTTTTTTDGDGDGGFHIDIGGGEVITTTTTTTEADADVGGFEINVGGSGGVITTTETVEITNDADVDVDVDADTDASTGFSLGGGIQTDADVEANADADASAGLSIGGGASLDVNVSFGFN